MTPELGQFALLLGLVLALVQGVVPLWGAHRGEARLMAVGAPAALLQALCLAVAFATLVHAYVVSDFSVVNVATNSHTDKPLIYKISGAWGNHEGSMLLWVLILALFGAALALGGSRLPPALKARALGVQGLVGVGFVGFLVFTSNPLARLDPPALNGQGLNPLLQDPGLALHPPMLYLGYVGFSMAFSLAVAALLQGRVDAAWARWVRPWTLAAWVCLTLGIGLGSWWAYYELGWGGWWFWDPVENASFIPWLAGTALLHSLTVVERREALKAWTVFLALVTFACALLGTFLVRSGVLTSVHAFAADPTRGVVILALLAVTVVGSFSLFAARSSALEGGGLFAPVSREGGLLLNNLLLTVAAATVLLGTLWPVLAEAVGSPPVSVGAPFFNATVLPLLAPLALLAGVGPLLPWKRGDLRGVGARLGLAFVLAAAAAGVGLWLGGARLTGLLAAVGLSFGAWVMASSLGDWLSKVRRGATGARLRAMTPSQHGMTLAHMAFGLFIVSLTGAELFRTEVVRALQPGETLTIADHRVVLDEIAEVRGPNYVAQEARLQVTLPSGHQITLTPQRRLYPAEGDRTTEAAVYGSWRADIYAVLGEGGADGTHVIRVKHKPMTVWLWTSMVLMGLGGVVALADRRRRVGVPKAAREAVA